MELDLEAALELFYGPRVVLARVVAGVIGRGDICDRFFVDADYLEGGEVSECIA